MKITKITEGNITTYFQDGVKKYRHFKSPDGCEWWEEYDEQGNEIHYKDNDGCESWSEYDEQGNEIHYKDNDGVERWNEDNPNNLKNENKNKKRRRKK
jgi:YD repeat-containing protein